MQPTFDAGDAAPGEAKGGNFGVVWYMLVGSLASASSPNKRRRVADTRRPQRSVIDCNSQGCRSMICLIATCGLERSRPRSRSRSRVPTQLKVSQQGGREREGGRRYVACGKLAYLHEQAGSASPCSQSSHAHRARLPLAATWPAFPLTFGSCRTDRRALVCFGAESERLCRSSLPPPPRRSRRSCSSDVP